MQLHGGRSRDENVAYTNFLILHEYKVGELPVVDRKTPAMSLLITYGLPTTDGSVASEYKHPTDIRAAFKDDRDRDYRMLLEWLQSLSIERPDYGIDMSKPPPH